MMKYAVILAGGTGSRAGGGVPKQFHEIAGRPLLWWSLRAFHEADPDTRLILVIHPDWQEYWDSLVAALPEEERGEYVAVAGGKDRVGSVENALSILPEGEEDDLVAVHDGARCCVTPQLIRRGWQTAAEMHTAVPVIPVTDSLRRVLGGANMSVCRSEYMAVQTPQVFSLPLLKSCFEKRQVGKEYTDDASIVEDHCGISLYPGDTDNIKVTNPGDFLRADIILKERFGLGMEKE